MNFNYDVSTIFFRKDINKRFLVMDNATIGLYEHNLILKCNTSHDLMAELYHQYTNCSPYNLHLLLDDNGILILKTAYIENLEYNDKMRLEMNIIFDEQFYYSDSKNYIRKGKINILKQKMENTSKFPL